MFLAHAIQVGAAFWVALAAACFLLFTYRSTLALHEDDSVHLSAAEVRFEAEQSALLRRISVVDHYLHVTGYAELGLTLLLVAAMVVNAVLTVD